MSRKILFHALLFIGSFACISSAHAMYNGSPDWKAPKVLNCKGIPEFPGGMKVEPHEVYGSSFDRYVFSTLDGVMGIYYFDMEFPPEHDEITGFVAYLHNDGPNTPWQSRDYAVTCKVSVWAK